MTDPSEPGDGDFRISKLRNSPESFGLLVDFLSRIEPFARYEFGTFSAALRQQLGRGEHLAAMTPKSLVGYCGWLPTKIAIAESWMANAGPLLPIPKQKADAVVLTVVAAPDRKVVTALLRRAREENPKLRVFFKREYASGTRTTRKSSVENVTGSGAAKREPDA
jgi:hypothetical protein